MDRMIEICKILRGYATESALEYGFWAEHDLIGFCIDPESVSKDDMMKLHCLGVFYDDEYDSLVMFT